MIPLSHQNLTARRWPVVTISIIALNLLVFLATNNRLQEQTAELGQARLHLLTLAATHPELEIPADAQPMVTAVKLHNPKLWQRMQRPDRQLEDVWDARIRTEDNRETLQEELNRLAGQYSKLAAGAITEKYAFVPAHPSPISYVTANFLHAGWLHLIGNMWFLWLAGLVLEDHWGRAVYSIFYLVSGAAALVFWGWMNAGSVTPTLGASGAVAALMGAFLIRFPKCKIHMMYLLFFRLRYFDAPAYALLPLWLLREVFYGAVGGAGNVANWAHVGGFLFGAVAAVTLRYSGVEGKVEASVEAKVNPEAQEVLDARALLDANRPEEALVLLKQHVARFPGALDAWTLLHDICWRRGDMTGYRDASLKLCQMYLGARELEPAWQYGKHYLESGTEPFPAATWLELCRLTEEGGDYLRALEEYRKLAARYPDAHTSLVAHLGAAKLCLRRLNRPADALTFYQAAADSPIPHLDWEQHIDLGTREARAALSAPAPVLNVT